MWLFFKNICISLMRPLLLLIVLCNIGLAQTPPSNNNNGPKNNLNELLKTDNEAALKVESPLGKPITSVKQISEGNQGSRDNAFKGVLIRVYEREETDYARFQKIMPNGEQIDFTPDLSIPTNLTYGEDAETYKTFLTKSVGRQFNVTYDDGDDSIVKVKIIGGDGGGQQQQSGSSSDVPEQYKYLNDLLKDAASGAAAGDKKGK